MQSIHTDFEKEQEAICWQWELFDKQEGCVEIRSKKSRSKGSISIVPLGGSLEGSGSVTKAFAMVDVIFEKRNNRNTSLKCDTLLILLVCTFKELKNVPEDR
jgi:hypothetical protein